MKRTKRRGSVTPGYSYGAVEKALGVVFGADSATQQSILRGRLRHFQRLGLSHIKAGRGARITYSREQADQLLIALLLTDIGITPDFVVKFIKRDWSQLKIWIGRATDGDAQAGNFIRLHVRPSMITTTWGGENNIYSSLPPSESTPLWIRAYRRWNPAFTRDHTISPGPEGTLGMLTINPPSPEVRWVAENVTQWLEEPIDEWVCVRNLTHVALKFEAALKKGGSDGSP